VALAKGTQQVGGCELDHSCHDPLTIKTTAVDQVYLEMDQARRDAEIERITASVMDEMHMAGLLDMARGASMTFAQKLNAFKKAENDQAVQDLLATMMVFPQLTQMKTLVEADHLTGGKKNLAAVKALNLVLASLDGFTEITIPVEPK
jgi:hypothetical protein